MQPTRKQNLLKALPLIQAEFIDQNCAAFVSGCSENARIDLMSAWYVTAGGSSLSTMAISARSRSRWLS